MSLSNALPMGGAFFCCTNIATGQKISCKQYKCNLGFRLNGQRGRSFQVGNQIKMNEKRDAI